VVEVRPPDARDEWEASWYRERLHDPSLIDFGVVVVVDGIGFLAVPVGGRRRGGYLAVDDFAMVGQLRAALAGLEGFPSVRVRRSTDPRVCHAVEWGDPAPRSDSEVIRGWFYGFSEQAVVRFCQERDVWPARRGRSATVRRHSW